MPYIGAAPAAVNDRHRFHVGQAVRLETRWIRGTVKITALRPARDQEPHYSIKRVSDEFQRTAGESELSAI